MILVAFHEDVVEEDVVEHVFSGPARALLAGRTRPFRTPTLQAWPWAVFP